jgi:hypothetical protein
MQDGPYLEFTYPGTSKALIQDYKMIETLIEIFYPEMNDLNPNWTSSHNECILEMNVCLAEGQGENRKNTSSSPLILPLVQHTPATTGTGKVLPGITRSLQLMVTSRRWRFP